MAASAYLNSSAGISSSERPSIFQLLASDAIAKAIRPAIEQFLRFASSRCHGRLGFIHHYCDEVSLLLQILLQQHQLRHHRALFEEHFYGLERELAGGSERRIIARSLIFSVLAPYLKAKLDNLFEKARDDEVDGISCRSPLLTRSRRVLLLVYPYLHLAYEASVFVYYLAYALEKANHHSPWTQLAGIYMRHAVPQSESEKATDVTREGTRARVPSLVARVGKALSMSLNVAAEGISRGLEVGAFFVQFLQWWYSFEGHSRDLASLPVPDPPLADEGASKTKCPICRGRRKNETLVPTSGYVFCYTCIVKFIRSKGICPVTKYPVKEEDLVRVYDSQKGN